MTPEETTPETRKPLISVRDVAVAYWLKAGLLKRRQFWALQDVSFDLFPGDSLGVIGKNGTGKSTLLRLLAGVMSPDTGEIIKPGVSTSLLTLTLGFLPYLSGRENAVLGGMFLGMPRKAVEAKLDKIIEFSELQEFIDQPISTYSSGMVARLGFAVAFQIQPDVLLIDEVLGVGDVDFQRKSRTVMMDRIRSNDTTIVLVSHDSKTILDLCNRAMWIEKKVIQAIGETRPVLMAYGRYLETGELPGQAPAILG